MRIDTLRVEFVCWMFNAIQNYSLFPNAILFSDEDLYERKRGKCAQRV